MVGNATFAFDLYDTLKGETGNLFFSPHSISMAMAMIHAGARGNTEAELASVLHFNTNQSKLHPLFNKLDQDLASRGQNAQAADGKAFRLNIVNATWGQKNYPFETSFLDTLALNYGAGLHVLDFGTSPEPSRNTINQWVENATEGRIKDLLPEGVIQNSTRLVLTNAVYFNAAWATPFKESNTTNDVFHVSDVTTVTVPTMHMVERLRYAKGQNYEAVDLPYDGHELGMLVIVPDSGQLQAVEASLAITVDDALTNLTDSQVTLALPKFEASTKVPVKDKLQQLGVNDAFDDGAADFSGVTGEEKLVITAVVHKAFVKVNEAGTEAAAATGVVAGPTSMPQPVTLTIDRPFIVAIRDYRTNAIIFLGRISDPS